MSFNEYMISKCRGDDFFCCYNAIAVGSNAEEIALLIIGDFSNFPFWHVFYLKLIA